MKHSYRLLTAMKYLMESFMRRHILHANPWGSHKLRYTLIINFYRFGASAGNLPISYASHSRSVTQFVYHSAQSLNSQYRYTRKCAT